MKIIFMCDWFDITHNQGTKVDNNYELISDFKLDRM